MRLPIVLIMSSFVGATQLFAISPGYKPPFPEFADFEHEGKCPALIDAATSGDVIATWDQEKLDLLYACSFAGPMPDGFMDGKVVFAKGGNYDVIRTYANSIGLPLDSENFKRFAETLWKGKHFYRKDRALLNRMGANVQPILGVNVAGQMRFPAKVYCGMSLLDARRESLIIDYAFTDTVVIDGKKPYIEAIDWIASDETQSGRHGLAVRDEIRMIRPGLYLGRAYLQKLHILNFILTTKTPPDGDDNCWRGYVKR